MRCNFMITLCYLCADKNKREFEVLVIVSFCQRFDLYEANFCVDPSTGFYASLNTKEYLMKAAYNPGADPGF